LPPREGAEPSAKEEGREGGRDPSGERRKKVNEEEGRKEKGKFQA